MTVQDVTNFVDYVGDNIVTIFAFNFRVDDPSWLTISYLVNFDVITLNADQDTTPGGTVSYTVPPPVATAIRIQRATPLNQNLDYTRYDPFDSEATENSLDKLTMEIQDAFDGLQAQIDLIIGGGAIITLQGTIDNSTLRWDTGNLAWEENITFQTGIGFAFLYDDLLLSNGIFLQNNVTFAGLFWDVGVANAAFYFGESAGGHTFQVDASRLQMVVGKAIRFEDGVSPAIFADVFCTDPYLRVVETGGLTHVQLFDLGLDLNQNIINDFAIQHQVVASVATVLTVNYKLGQSILTTLTENIATFTINNWPAVGLAQQEYEILQDAATPFTIAWPAAVEWIGGIAPDLSNLSSRNLVRLRTRDGGTTIMGTFGEDFS